MNPLEKTPNSVRPKDTPERHKELYRKPEKKVSETPKGETHTEVKEMAPKKPKKKPKY